MHTHANILASVAKEGKRKVSTIDPSLNGVPMNHTDVVDEIMAYLIEPTPEDYWQSHSSGEWAWIDSNPRNTFVHHLVSKDAKKLGDAFAGFPDDPAWFGLATPVKSESQLRPIVGDIQVEEDTFHNFSVLENYLEDFGRPDWWTCEVAISLLNSAIPAGPSLPGKPLVLPDTPRHLFLALQLLSSANVSGKLSVLEIGPGYGGSLYVMHKLSQVMQKNLRLIAVDLPISLLFTYYFLRRRGVSVTVTLGTSPVESDPHADIHLFASDAVSQIDTNIDLLLNSRSLSEMNLRDTKNYLHLIENHWQPVNVLFENADVMAFSNSPRHSESMMSDHLKQLPSYEVVKRRFSPFSGGRSRYFITSLRRSEY